MDENKELVHDKLGDVIDSNNMASGDTTIYDQVIEIEEVKITGAMKILFILFGVIGAFYSLSVYGIFQFLIWSVAVVFIMDILGIFDKVRDSIRESNKPRGGYEQIRV
jgi:hypothetical protein